MILSVLLGLQPSAQKELPSFLDSSNTYSYVLIISILFLSGIVAILLIYTLIYLILKNKHDSIRGKWHNIINILIQNCLFSDEGDQAFVIPAGVQKLLKLRSFRRVLTKELMEARKSFSGGAGANLLALYEQLNLKASSMEKLNSRLWHIKAQGIQELANLNQIEELGAIYKFTDDQNEQVRMEAQLAVVQLSGFDGLNFLDFLSYPLSDWQQVKLLAELPGAHQSSSARIEVWLKANFSSVVMFSLKLIAAYQHFELYPAVKRCLSHSEARVRLQAIHTLKEICTEETANELIGIYYSEDLYNKLQILKVLKQIGTREILPFLFTELEKENNQVKVEAARAVSAIGSNKSLQSFPEAKVYPWNQIISQVVEEMAA